MRCYIIVVVWLLLVFIFYVNLWDGVSDVKYE